MLDLSAPIYLYTANERGRKERQVWLCEWKSFVHAKAPQAGAFLVHASHVLAASHAAKKILRDELVRCRQFTFKVRLPDPKETAQLKAALHPAERVETGNREATHA